MAIQATIVTSFNDGSGTSILVGELDSVRNNDKTTFLPSETAFFIIYKYPSTLQVSRPVPTAGMVTNHGQTTRTKTEVVEFVGSKTAALSYPPNGDVVVNEWYGNIGNDFIVSGFTASITSESPCLCKVTYTTTGDLWELFPPSLPNNTVDYPVRIYVTAEDAS